MNLEGKNIQLTLNDEKIDEIIRNLEMLKKDNNKVIQISGSDGKPGIMILHSKFDKSKLAKSSK